jgi:hypothetical protein
MSRRKRRAPHQSLVAIDHQDLDRGAIKHPGRCLPSRGRHRVAKRDALRGRLCKHLRRGVGQKNVVAERGGRARSPRALRQEAQIHGDALRMQIQKTLGEFGDLGHPPGEAETRNAMAAQTVSMPPTKSPTSISAASGRL